MVQKWCEVLQDIVFSDENRQIAGSTSEFRIPTDILD
jgi:hypothetical protein